MDGSMGRWRRPIDLVAEAAHMSDLCLGFCWLLLFAVRLSLPSLSVSSPLLCLSPLPMSGYPAEDAAEYHGDRWAMFSRAGDDEVDDILAAATTWTDLERRMHAAVHQEINDTAVRERVHEFFEQRLRDQAADGGAPFVSYKEYCMERRRQTEEAVRAEQDAASAGDANHTQ